MSRYFQILLVACIAVALCAAEPPRYRTRAARLQAPRRRFFLARQELEEAAVTPYPTAKELKPEVPFEEVGPAVGPSIVPEAGPAAAPGPIAGPAAAPAGPEAIPAEESPAFGPGSFDSGAIDSAGAIPAPGDETDVGVDVELEGEHVPDLTYGPPEADDAPAIPDEDNEIADVPALLPTDEIEATIAEEEDSAAAAEEQLRAERLTAARRGRFRARPAKLRAAPKRLRAAKLRAAKLRAARLQALPQQQQLIAAQPQFAAQQQQPVFYYMSQYQMW